MSSFKSHALFYKKLKRYLIVILSERNLVDSFLAKLPFILLVILTQKFSVPLKKVKGSDARKPSITGKFHG